jgi:hypothetical protein
VRKYDLNVIFTTSSAKTRTILVEMNSDFEKLTKNPRNTELTFIEGLHETLRKEGLNSFDPNLFSDYLLYYEEIKDNFTDFDLFQDKFCRKGASTDIFEITGQYATANYSGVQMGYQLVSWGAMEQYKGRDIYVPMDDIKVGYPLKMKDFGSKIFLMDTALGNGYSSTLTLAHSLASYKRVARNLITRYIANDYNLKMSLKEQLKWRYFS